MRQREAVRVRERVGAFAKELTTKRKSNVFALRRVQQQWKEEKYLERARARKRTQVSMIMAKKLALQIGAEIS